MWGWYGKSQESGHTTSADKGCSWSNCFCSRVGSPPMELSLPHPRYLHHLGELLKEYVTCLALLNKPNLEGWFPQSYLLEMKYFTNHSSSTIAVRSHCSDIIIYYVFLSLLLLSLLLLLLFFLSLLLLLLLLIIIIYY